MSAEFDKWRDGSEVVVTQLGWAPAYSQLHFHLGEELTRPGQYLPIGAFMFYASYSDGYFDLPHRMHEIWEAYFRTEDGDVYHFNTRDGGMYSGKKGRGWSNLIHLEREEYGNSRIVIGEKFSYGNGETAPVREIVTDEGYFQLPFNELNPTVKKIQSLGELRLNPIYYDHFKLRATDLKDYSRRMDELSRLFVEARGNLEAGNEILADVRDYPLFFDLSPVK